MHQRRRPRALRLLAALTLAAASLGTVTQAANAAHGDYTTYYNKLDTGPAYIPFVDTSFVPQGLTKLGENSLVISYYDSKSSPAKSRLAVVNRTTGARTAWYTLNTTGHVGGLAVTSKYLWVSQDGKLYRYSRTKLTGGSGTALTADKGFNVSASSWAFGQGETVWVGSFGSFGADGSCPSSSQRPRMYQYVVGADGNLAYRTSFITPPRVQGAALTNNKFVFSTSCGRNNDSRLWVGPAANFGTGSWRSIVAPNMSEGMVIANNELQILYESGSAFYNDADYRVRTIHHGSYAGIERRAGRAGVRAHRTPAQRAPPERVEPLGLPPRLGRRSQQLRLTPQSHRHVANPYDLNLTPAGLCRASPPVNEQCDENELVERRKKRSCVRTPRATRQKSGAARASDERRRLGNPECVRRSGVLSGWTVDEPVDKCAQILRDPRSRRADLVVMDGNLRDAPYGGENCETPAPEGHLHVVGGAEVLSH